MSFRQCTEFLSLKCPRMPFLRWRKHRYAAWYTCTTQYIVV